jgi:hypothetical protein
MTPTASGDPPVPGGRMSRGANCRRFVQNPCRAMPLALQSARLEGRRACGRRASACRAPFADETADVANSARLIRYQLPT